MKEGRGGSDEFQQEIGREGGRVGGSIVWNVFFLADLEMRCVCFGENRGTIAALYSHCYPALFTE